MPFHNDDPKPLSLLQRILAGYTPNWRANLDAPPVEERGPDYRELQRLQGLMDAPSDATSWPKLPEQPRQQPTIGPIDDTPLPRGAPGGLFRTCLLYTSPSPRD